MILNFSRAIALKSFQLCLIASSIASFNISGFNTAASAQPKPEAIEVSPELNRLEYFEGSWSCRQPANSTKPSGEFTWTVKRDLNDFWFIGRGEQVQASTPNSQPISSQDFLGYDVAKQQLVRSVVVGDGSRYTMTADDWSDKALIWEGILTRKGKTVPLRQVMVQDSPDKFTITYFLRAESGDWQPLVDEACTRKSQKS